MFLFRRHFLSPLEILLLLLGLGFLVKRHNTFDRPTDEDLRQCRAKRKEFRRRLRSAFSVFDEEEPAPAPNQPQA